MTKYLGKQTTIADSTSTISNVKSISAPALTIDELDITTHGTSQWKEFSAGLKSVGTFDVVIFYDGADASFNRLWLRAHGDASGNTDTYTITFPDSDTMIFTGIITGISIDPVIDDDMKATITFRPTGAITGTIGT